MKILVWFIVVVIFTGAEIPLAEALVIEKPVEGQTIVVGKPFALVVRPEPMDNCAWAIKPDIQLNPKTGKFEDEYVFTPEDSAKLGLINFSVLGEPVGGADSECSDSDSVKINLVLPSTATVTKIHADFVSTVSPKATSAKIARKPSGDFVALDGNSERRISIGATYSDGVKRDIAGNPNIIYKSLNEKVAIVFSPGKWKDSDGDVVESHALVRATGPGKTDIIVKYGEFTDRVTLKVRECPYIEGKMKHGCPR